MEKIMGLGIKKILIANRGEIVLRIQRSAKKLGIKTVVIYALQDKSALFVRHADEAVSLGDGDLKDTYLNIRKIITLAQTTSCDAIHPGYGFLAENYLFAEQCENKGIRFIGPQSHIIRLMGSKIEATNYVEKLGIPTLKRITGTPEKIKTQINGFSFPALVKASAGGGGKGMKIINSISELGESLTETSRQAQNYFGDGTIYIEKFIKNPRHIEVQLLADNLGKVVHLFDRECSIQRRYQKIIEEAPSPSLDEKLRDKILADAVKIAQSSAYTNAGTIEFLLDESGQYYFLEMNTRIQVEHAVTELITGIDIVKEQILIAAGNPLSFSQKDIVINGCAIEARVYAEDPHNDFRPSPGKILFYNEPEDKNIRIDSGVETGSEIFSQYDPMISKIIAFGENREMAIQLLTKNLNRYIIHGIKNNIGFLENLINSQEFKKNNISTTYIDNRDRDFQTEMSAQNPAPDIHFIAASAIISLEQMKLKTANVNSVWASIGYWRQLNKLTIQFDEQEYDLRFKTTSAGEYLIFFNNKEYEIKVISENQNFYTIASNGIHLNVFYSKFENNGIYVSGNSQTHLLIRNDILDPDENYLKHRDTVLNSDNNVIKSPLVGKVLKLFARENSPVKAGDPLFIIESMKMENNICALFNGVIKNIKVKEGDFVKNDTVLAEFK
ncbi:MAG: biotin/lipoyl-binding protein [Bacteroidales bacterium]|nr:biotin/lipoyl-binding protein [Bacteroidales bacterium]